MIFELIQSNTIEIFLQPIVSIKDKKIFGYEALTRAYDPDGNYITPPELFAQAKKEKMSCKLDDYVKELALVKFQHYYNNDTNLLLFLNFESSIINNGIEDDFVSIASKYEIPFNNIVIEIKEDMIQNTNILKNFVSKYKKYGFIIAIDDFGTGYSSFDRLEVIKPDIVKIDMSLIRNIHDNFINSEILTAISHMCHRIGALLLAEGTEHKNEILTCMKKDIDIFQGYWFCEPSSIIEDNKKKKIHDGMHDICALYKYTIQEHINKNRQLVRDSQELARRVIEILEGDALNSFELIKDIIAQTPQLEAIYMIDGVVGSQVGDTIIDAQQKVLYNPTNNGHDHSLKEYYLIAKESLNGDYLSSKYISKASGNMCRTYSVKVNIEQQQYIICFDIVA